MEHTPLTGRRRALPAIAVLTAAVAACSAGPAGGAPSTSPASSRSAAKNAPAGNMNPGLRPVASGEIAQITGRTLQVQSETDQTAVTYTTSTHFTTEKKTTLAGVKVGECVLATAPRWPSGSSHSSITATSVHVSDPTSGGCGPRAAGPGSASGAPPSGFPSGALPSGVIGQGTPPSGAPGGGKFTPGAAVAGTVTAVHGSTISVATATPSGTSATDAVRVTAATTFSITVPTTHKALRVGLCAVVNGSTNSSGAVSATRIALSPKTDGSCTELVRRGPNG